MNQEEQRFVAIKGVIDRVLWTAGATEVNRKLLADAISDELAAYTAAVEAIEREYIIEEIANYFEGQKTDSCPGTIISKEIRSLK